MSGGERQVTDPDDPRLTPFLGLRDQATRKRREAPGGDMADVFIAEGDLVIERGLEAGLRLRAVLVDDARAKPLELPTDAEVLRAAPNVLDVVAGWPTLRDPIACFERPTLPDPTSLLQMAKRVAVLEGINNPNNLGVIMRNAAGLGLDAVLLDPTCGDPLYRRAIRASMGQVFAIPHARIDALPSALSTLHDAGFDTIALTPSADAQLHELELGPRRAILLGAEGPGLTDATISACGYAGRIDMARSVDSLNVGSAAAIAFHALR